jgi:SpoVK/Ycf46/Vps4 family AAA+-type ATPase
MQNAQFQEKLQMQTSTLNPFCNVCHKFNRKIAKFCRYCGSEIKVQFTSIPSTPHLDLQDIVGLDSIKEEIIGMSNQIRLFKERKKIGLPAEAPYLHSIFMGNTGTGKTLVARYMAKAFQELGLLSKGNILEIRESEMKKIGQNPKEQIKKWIEKAKGGILFFDEVHKYVESISGIVSTLEFAGDDIIVVLGGIPEPIKEYFNTHPDDRQRVGKFLTFSDYNADVLSKITLQKMKSLSLEFPTDLEPILFEYVHITLYSSKSEFKNGWLVERTIIPEIQKRQSERLTKEELFTPDSLRMITLKDLPVEALNKKTPEEVIRSLDSLVGLENLKRDVKSIAETIQIQKEQKALGMNISTFGVHFVFTGNPGTGKTTVARMLGDLFKAMDYLPGGQVIEVDRSKLVAQYVGQTAPNVNSYCDRAMGGILFIDEAYALSGEEGNRDTYGQEAIDTLLKRMEDDRGKFIVIVAGYEKQMEGFLTSNPGLKSRFTNYLHFEDYKPEELNLIFKGFLVNSKYIFNDDVLHNSYLALKDIYSKKDKNFANGREVRNLFEKSYQKMNGRLSKISADQKNSETIRTFLTEDIAYTIPKESSVDEILEELNQLVGMDSLKEEVLDLLNFVKIQKKREELENKKMQLTMHFVLTGNPGTGKTTVARILGKLFKSVGILPNDKIVEVDKAGLVGQYVGSTPKKVHSVVDSAIGGILFIDEAYTLTPEQGIDTYSQEAIDTLMKRMEDDRGKFIVIAAGYKKEMDCFLSVNPGLKSRFNRSFHFEDYKPEELEELFLHITNKNGYYLNEEAIVVLKKVCKEMYDKRDITFGNGRDIRNLFDNLLNKQQGPRIKLEYPNLDPIDPKELSTIKAIDLLPYTTLHSTKKSLEECLQSLNSLIGLSSVKQEINSLINYLKIEALRLEEGSSKNSLALHFIFSGNPGTGKTTVARIIADIFREIGLLSKGHLIETDRSGLEGEYLGQTAPKTQAMINSAMGGVLFIDEAYSLTPEGSGNDYGKEAIDTLLKRMEDDRGKFIVIAAGYKNEMKRFLDSNPGLISRFTKFIDFEDYSPLELAEIYISLATSQNFTFSETFRETVLQKTRNLYQNRDQNFANGREIRNLFEKTKQNQSDRILKEGVGLEKSGLYFLKEEDLP